MNTHSNDHFEPPWFGLPSAFYAKLNELARMLHVKREVVLHRALRALEKEYERRKAPAPSRQASSLSSHRWSKVPPGKRSEIARELARKRWNPQ
jgi:hypothetical protein